MAVLGTARPRAETSLASLFENVYLQIVSQIVFRQDTNASKLCFVTSDESFASFFTLISCTGKSHVFFVLEMYLKCFGF